MDNDFSRKLPEKNKNSPLVTREPRPLKEVPEQYDTLKQNICQLELVKPENKKIAFRKPTKESHPNGCITQLLCPSNKKGDQAISSVKSFTLLHLFQRHRLKTRRLLR